MFCIDIQTFRLIKTNLKFIPVFSEFFKNNEIYLLLPKFPQSTVKYIIACILTFSTILLSAQLNPSNVYVSSKYNELSSVLIQSTNVAPNFTITPDVGQDTMYIHSLGNNQYEVRYTPPAGFIGETELVVEYFEPGPIPGIPSSNYTKVHYQVKSSDIDPGTDRYLASSDTLTFDVLANDSASDGPLTISKLGIVEGGTASIGANGTDISFSFNSGADDALIRYFVEDTLGNRESALVFLNKDNESLIATKDIYTDNKSFYELRLSSSLYEIEDAPQNGALSITTDNHVWLYTPNTTYTGQDTFSFSTPNGGLLSYNVEILDKANNATFVVDDEYFLTTDGSLTFNVFDNDLKLGQTIMDYSSELTYNGNGEFSYTPDAGFEGDEVFYYKIFSGYKFHTGSIVIHVNDFAPVSDLVYEFNILENHDLKTKHHSPVGDYTFELLVAPTNGTVTILDANGSEILECDTISGNNTIIYSPDADFNGIEEFDLEYCTLSGHCEVVKVNVNVLDSNYDDCLCLNGCVYKGDSNDDGVVDMKDVLDMSLNIGRGGYERTNDFNLLWTGQDSDDWGYSQMGAGIDLKCSDADGDGYIDHSDFSEIQSNYSNVHKFKAQDLAATSNVPIYFIPPSTPVDSGEWITLDIAIGNASLAAIDLYGAAFTINFDPSIMDSSSVQFSLYDDNWLEQSSPLLQDFNVPQDGQVDIAVSRVTNISTDGFGIIGKLEFIVEDEIVGIKRNDLGKFLSSVKVTNIISTDAFGKYKSHPDYTDFIEFDADGLTTEEELLQSISVSPNPTASVLTINADKYNIDQISLFDPVGRTIIQNQIVGARSYDLDMSALQQGVYFLQIQSHESSIIKKVQKVE